MRSTYCGQVSETLMDQTVTLMGWAHRRRDHGGVIFIDLRDREGLVQVVCDPDRAEMFATAEGVRNEFCLQVTGRVRARPAGTENANLTSGKVEVLCHELVVLNPSVTPPFQLDDENLSETVRLTHRVLDLRRPEMQRNLRLRYRIAIEVRKFLDEQGFIDIETPMLTKSTPEGARDYLVPSRVHDGHFFALPQSPQLFKQLLMVAGFDRYYQITKCFRDEDLRADRQPEFTQIDIETSFLAEDEIRAITEAMIRSVFRRALGVELPPYAADDLRRRHAQIRLRQARPARQARIHRTHRAHEDGGFQGLLGPGHDTRRARGGAAHPGRRRDEPQRDRRLHRVREDLRRQGPGLDQGQRRREGPRRPAEPGREEPARRGPGRDHRAHRRAQRRPAVLRRRQGQDRERRASARCALKVGHSEFGRKHGLVAEGWAPLWVVDFPMFEYDEESQRWNAVHHPFTAPKEGHEDFMDTDPGRCVAKAYDMVLNGWEIGGGSVRIHRAEVQSKVFRALKIGPEEAQLKFGFLLDALKYGAPPHGGLAFGLDRIATLMAGAESIRDVIAFPKTQRAQCLLTGAPSLVDEEQLRELHIRLRNPTPAA